MPLWSSLMPNSLDPTALLEDRFLKRVATMICCTLAIPDAFSEVRYFVMSCIFVTLSATQRFFILLGLRCVAFFDGLKLS